VRFIDIVVIGGGISGLSAAFRIRQALPHAAITLLEADGRVGGKIQTELRDGFTLEAGPNGFLDSKPSTVQLCRDLGLGGQLLVASEGSRKNRYLFLKGELQRLPGDPFGLLGTPLLSLSGKLAMLAEPFRRRRGNGSEESVAEFARRRFGREAADIFVDALVTGIHAGDPEKLSVRAAFPRLVKMEAEAGSVLKGFLRAAKVKKRAAQARGEKSQPQRMWSFAGGLGVLIHALRESLGDIVRTGVRVRRIERTASGYLVRGDGSESWPADVIVHTAPASAQSESLQEFDPALAEELASVKFTPVNVVLLGYRTQDAPMAPDGFGYIAPQNTRRDVLGLQWCSAIFPGRAPPGMVLWRALCGGVNRTDVTHWPDDILVSAVHREMQLAMKVTAAPVFTQVIRWPQAIPQYEVGHMARLARIDELGAKHPGLILAGNSHRGVAMNDCTEQAEVIAARLSGQWSVIAERFSVLTTDH